MSRSRDKEKSASPTEIEPMTFRKPVGCYFSELRRTRGDLGRIQGPRMTPVLLLYSFFTKELINQSVKIGSHLQTRQSDFPKWF